MLSSFRFAFDPFTSQLDEAHNHLTLKSRGFLLSLIFNLILCLCQTRDISVNTVVFFYILPPYLS